MTLDEFVNKARQALPVGAVFNNPRSGTSTIIHFENTHICYQRGDSCIRIKLVDIFETYVRFAGNRCDSSDLKEFRSSVFSQSAHSCNCTFFFIVLHAMGLSSAPYKSPKNSNAFCVDVEEKAQA
jgi:hypothetical protein